MDEPTIVINCDMTVVPRGSAVILKCDMPMTRNQIAASQEALRRFREENGVAVLLIPYNVSVEAVLNSLPERENLPTKLD